MFHCQILATCWEKHNYIYYAIIPLDAVSMAIPFLIKSWQGEKSVIWMRSLQKNDEMHCLNCHPHVLIMQLLKEKSHLGLKGLLCECQPWVTANLGPGSVLFKIDSKTSLYVIKSRSRALKFTENRNESKERLNNTVCYWCSNGLEKTDKGQH